MSSSDIRKLIASDERSFVRIDKFLLSLEGIGSRSKAAKMIQQGKVKVNHKEVKASYEVNPGDVIEIEFPPPTSTGIAATPMSLDIFYEDQDLLVINKPSGLVVHPATSHQTDTLVNGLLSHTRNLSMGVNEERPGIVHRLDKDTSGLLVIAKNDETHRHLAAQFSEKTTHRRYRAIVFGKPKNEKGTLRSHLARHPVHRKKYSSCNPPKGKEAVTHYQVISSSATGLSLIQLQLETGRTHQIRVHLSEIHHSIVGDELYGGIKPAKNLKSTRLRGLIQNMPRFALHASELGFVHPRWHRPLLFSAGWPSNLLALVEAAGFEREI